ncbi:hypothetical protein JCM10450v2_004348 [Rhodotorula kratochvilovae]
MPSFLSPALPTSSSFAAEVEQDIRRREGTADSSYADGARFSAPVSFPAAHAARSPSGLGTAQPMRANGQENGYGPSYGHGTGINNGSVIFPSSGSRPLSRTSGSTVLPYDRSHDGHSADSHAAPPAAVIVNGYSHMPASSRMTRPPSQSSMRARAAHPSRMGAAAASIRSPNGDAAMGFAYSHDGGVPRQVTRERLSDDEEEDERERRAFRPQGMSRSNSARRGGVDAEDNSPDADRVGEIDFDGRERVRNGYGAGEAEGEERENGNLSREEAWYFLRALVGQEIADEEGMLWKLRDLDGPPEDGGHAEGVDPSDIPILRYLIRHFLLTLPLVRDTTAEGDVPSFWTEGLFPIIRSLHDADLSKPVDRGYTGTVSRLYGSSLRNALERFVTAGLKLSSASYETGERDSPPAPPMQPQPSTALTQRYNFQPLVPPPIAEVDSPAASANGQKSRPVSAATSASSWSRRFSINRLFGSTSGSPVKTAPMSPPRIPLPAPSSPFAPQDPSSASETDHAPSDTRRDSAGPARPDSAVLPFVPFVGAAAEHAHPRASTSTFGAPTPENAASDDQVEELSLQRTRSRTASALDAQSFVTAEGAASRNAQSEADGDEDVTVRFPNELPLPSTTSGAPPVQVEPSSSASSAYATPAPSAGLVPPRAYYAKVGSEGTATDTEGFELYPSDAADTPKREKSSFLEGGETEAAFASEDASVGEAVAAEADPYVVDEPSEPSHGLAPPVPTIPLPYESPKSAAAAQLPSASSAERPEPPRISTSSNHSRAPVQIPAGGDRTATSEKRNRKFGLGALIQNVRRGSSSGASGSAGSPSSAIARTGLNEVPASRRVPFASPQPRAETDFVAHSTLPAEFLPPSARYTTSDEEASPGQYEPRAALPPVLVPKGGVKWPYDAPVPFVQGPDFEQLKWGGFEADIVGVRNTLFSHSYIIRVRRPGRLDEFVLRTEAQFVKFYRNMDKAFPHAHIRRIPAGDPKNDTVIRPRPSLPIIPSAVSLHSGAEGLGESEPVSRSHSRLMNGLRAAAGDPHGSFAMSRAPTRSSVGSTFARSLRAQSVHAPSEAKTVRQRRSRAASLSASHLQRPQSAAGSYRSYPTSFGSRVGVPVEIGKKMPPHDPRRRALRAWLRDVLSVRTVGHHKETAAFLLAASIVPRDGDVIDIAKREAIDDARRNARSTDAQQSIEKVRAARKQWSAVEKEVIHGEGLSEISEALKTTRALDQLPVKYQKVLESLRLNFAQTLYDTLVGGETSGATFSKLKALHSTFPWFLVKQALRLKGSNFMARRLQDILISRPFGGKSLLQKILAITLDDDPARLAKEMDRIQARIGSAVMVEKLNLFVHESREKKAIIRRYAEENNIELVLCIVRGADEPRLPGFELDRITAASKAYRKWAKTNPSPLAKLQVKDAEIRLVLDLQAYLRLASRDRDSTVLRQLLAEEDFTSAVEVVAQPFVSLLKRTYKVGHGAQALSDLQKFLDQLVIILEALRSRIQDPQKSVRVIARLLQRHQQNLYSFLRSVHRGETIVEEFLQWAWTASVFLRRGLAQPIDLDELVPPERDEDKAYLLDELEDLVAFHRAKRLDAFEAACRRAAGDVDADDPILVEGDGKGRSRVEPVEEPKPRRPVLSEVPLYAAAFKEQLKSVFSV